MNYGNYMKTKGIKREDAEAEAMKLGWTIPEEQFIVVEVKRGRKPKSKKDNVEASDTEDEKDLFKEAAKAAAEASSSDDDSSDDDEVLVETTKKRKANRKKTSLKLAEESESSSGEQEPKRVRTEEEEDSELEEEKMNKSDEEDEEVEADVEPFEHDGKNYLIDTEDTVYDANTHAPVGQYDRENDSITVL